MALQSITANVQPIDSAPLLSAREALAYASQCESLLNVLMGELSDNKLTRQHADIVAVLDDLAARVYRHFWESSDDGYGGASSELSGLAGKLHAAIYTMHLMATRQSKASEETQNQHELCLIGWMQYIASDLVEELLPLMEQTFETNERSGHS